MARSLFAALVWLAACGAPAPTGSDAIGPLPASPVQRCINLSNALEAPAEGDWGYTVREADLQKIAAAGFDTVRLPVKFSAHAGDAPPYRLDPAILRRVDEIVSQAGAAGLQIIVDVHHYDEINQDPGRHIPRLIEIWQQLSAHFDGAPNSVIFEILNEPHTQMTVARTDQLNQDVLAVIRERHPDRWVIVGSAQWGALDAWLEADMPQDPRLISTFHYYSPWEFTHQGAAWMDDPPSFGRVWGTEADLLQMERDFGEAQRKAQIDGLPVLVGEFGVYRGVGMSERSDWIEAVRSSVEQSGFGWCHWGFAADFGAYDPDTEAWVPEIMSALGLNPPLRDR